MGKGRARPGTPLTPAEQAQRKAASKKSPWRGTGRKERRQ